MSKILIFGGSGFLGQHLVKKMQGNYDFSFITHNSKDLSNNSIKGDILQPNSYESVLENSDTIINLVGQIDPNIFQSHLANPNNVLSLFEINMLFYHNSQCKILSTPHL